VARLGDAYAAVLTEHHCIIREALAANEGREVSTAGDGFFAVFGSPRACLTAATDVQLKLGSHDWPKGEQVRVRIGVHTGEASDEAAVGLTGLDVHKAARIAAVGHGGQVLVSEATAILVRDLLSEGVSLRELGSHRLKDLSRSEVIFQLEAPGLESKFPPIKSLDNPELRHNLPVQLTSFVGRATELGELRELVASSRLVTLVGTGGCGKTRLALQVAADLLDGSGDGTWFVDLAPIADQDEVAASVASVFHLRRGGSRPVSEELIDALRDRRLLVVLDNCEHLIDACAKLAHGLLLSCPGVHILATSREPLGLDGEQLYQVPSLSVAPTDDESVEAAFSSDAVQLFVDRARVHSSGFVLDDKSAPAVVSICAQLDGIPLALELAAARLRSLSVTEIDARLGDRFRLLTGGSRTALPRQQTLRATMDWSYESLNERDRAVFDRLSVFSGGFDLAAAEAVCTCEVVESYEVIDAISSLVDKSLVRAESGEERIRYGLLETSRQYVAEHLATDATAEASARRAHALAFLELAEAAAVHLRGPDQVACRERLELDRDNLRAAGAELLTASGTTSAALRFAVSLLSFWVTTGNHRWGVEHTEEALSRADAGDSPALEARACRLVARLYAGLALSSPVAHEREAAYIERGLAIAAACDDDEVLSQLLVEKAYLVEDDAVMGVCDEAVAAARRSGVERSIANALNSRGDLSSDPDGAEADLLEAAGYWSRLGEFANLGRTLVNLGDLELERGNRDAARAHFERGLEIADPAAALTLRLLLVSLALLDGDIDRAARLNATVLGMPDKLSTHHLAYAMLHAALCLSATGKSEHSAELHGAADALADMVKESWDSSEDGMRTEDHGRLRLALGQVGFEEKYAAGRRLAAKEATALAAERLAQLITGEAHGEPSPLRTHERADHVH
jgi:predicted ATPase